MKDLLPRLSPGTLIAQIITGCLAYYLLVSDNCMHCSIATIIHYAHSLAVNQHLMLLGLLPIYIGAIIFGSALLGASLGTRLEDQMIRPFRQRMSKISY